MGIVSDRDILLIKLDPFGDPVWQRTYGGPFDERAGGFVELADGGFAVFGARPLNRMRAEKASCLRLSATGEIVWQTIYQGWDAYATS